MISEIKFHSRQTCLSFSHSLGHARPSRHVVLNKLRVSFISTIFSASPIKFIGDAYDRISSTGVPMFMSESRATKFTRYPGNQRKTEGKLVLFRAAKGFFLTRVTADKKLPRDLTFSSCASISNSLDHRRCGFSPRANAKEPPRRETGDARTQQEERQIENGKSTFSENSLSGGN